jgi:hypothetical protein
VTAGRVGVGGDGKHCRLGRSRLGPNGPPDHCDQVHDRQLEDEHQEDDLDHRQAILGVVASAHGPFAPARQAGFVVSKP